MSTTAAESSSEEEIQIGQKGRVKKDREEEDEHQPTYICTNLTSHQALSRVQGSF